MIKNLCKVEIGKEGSDFVVVITHLSPPVGDKRSEVPAQEFRASNTEDLLMEMKKYQQGMSRFSKESDLLKGSTDTPRGAML